MKKVTVKYFAQLREWANKDSEVICFDGNTYRDLYLDMAQRYNFKLSIDILQIAINDEFAKFDHEVQNDDVVVFIPPVAGG